VQAAIRLSGVVEDGGQRQTREEPERPGAVSRLLGSRDNGTRELITAFWPRRESEGFIVASKLGNSSGAKGPCRRFVAQDEACSAWLRPTTDLSPLPR
jgi:hypothetical protein